MKLAKRSIYRADDGQDNISNLRDLLDKANEKVSKLEREAVESKEE